MLNSNNGNSHPTKMLTIIFFTITNCKPRRYNHSVHPLLLLSNIWEHWHRIRWIDRIHQWMWRASGTAQLGVSDLLSVVKSDDLAGRSFPFLNHPRARFVV